MINESKKPDAGHGRNKVFQKSARSALPARGARVEERHDVPGFLVRLLGRERLKGVSETSARRSRCD
jgi:hypothetical protein